jgi:ABC-2 type transport system permease protein
MGVMALLTYILPHIQQGLSGILEEVPFLDSLLTGLLGTKLGDDLTARAMQAFLYVHPVVLALIWGLEIALCTRVPAGEIDRGTIDLLLGLPVSRRAVYACESFVWLVSGLFVLSLGLIGHRLAAPVMADEMRPRLSESLLIMGNLYCVYIAVGGIAFFVSALSDRRNRAMLIVFGIVLASFFLNFVAQFWDPAKQVAWLSVMQYYRPAEILQSGTFPLRDVAILLSVGAIGWALGGEIVARRNISTV